MRRIRVTSPNFEKEDQNQRKWKGRLDTGAQILFEIIAEDFWLRLKNAEIEFGEATVIKVQLASRLENRRVKDHKVVRVLTIDEVELAAPLADDALNAVLGAYKHDVNRPDTPDLFAES